MCFASTANKRASLKVTENRLYLVQREHKVVEEEEEEKEKRGITCTS